MGNLRAVVKILLFALISLILVPLQMMVMAVHRGKNAYIIPYFWQKMVCLIFSIRVTVHGTPVKNSQLIYVSNHLSYLDIPVIGSVLKASFVAKKDVSKWPVFGFLSKLQQTAFIERSRGAAVKEASALDEMLDSGKSLILFPEGTSTDGREVVPFKSSLFSLVFKSPEKALPIQPFSIEMISVDGKKPDTQELRDLYSWHRDMDTELPQHLWRFAKSNGAHIALGFYPVIPAGQLNDRKLLAAHCYETINSALHPKPSLAA